MIYDIVIPDINYDDESPINNLFIVMEAVDNDMDILIA